MSFFFLSLRAIRWVDEDADFFKQIGRFFGGGKKKEGGDDDEPKGGKK